MTINSMGELQRQFALRAQQSGLKVECGMDGAFFSEIAVVAEAPGHEEVRTRVPLIGFDGKRLFNALRKLGINRHQVYTTNVIKRQLVRQMNKDNIKRHELDNWAGLLRWELTRLPNLKYVLIAGGYALEALMRLHGITKWRGSVMDFPLYDGSTNTTKTFTGLCCFNPAQVRHDPKTELVFLMDVAKLPKIMKGEWKPHEIKHHINPSFADAMDWIDMMQKGDAPISYDIETISGQTACIGLANQAHEGMCINFRDATKNVFSAEGDKKLYTRLQQMFDDPNCRFVAQNATFDMYWLWYKDRIRVPRTWWDTLLAHHTLYPTLPHNLGFLTAQYTNHPFYKDDKDQFREGQNIDAFWQYNVKDVCITWAVHERERNELNSQGLLDFFHDHVMRLQHHLVLMTVGGVRIDRTLKARLTEELSAEIATLKEQFQSAVVDALKDPDYQPNPNSTPQMRELFFRRLMLVGRGYAVDKMNKDRMLAHPRTGPKAREIIEAHTKYKEQQKFFSTYVDVAIDPDDRMRCEYKQFGTQRAPGRLSSSAVMWGTGTNLQNQPERAYDQFVADSGYGFGYFDLEQAEARVVAYEANIPLWKEQFERARVSGGYDCHRALAAEMFGMPYDEVPTYDRDADGNVSLRFVAKRCRHGLNYRMDYPRLAEVTGLPIYRAQEAYNLYHQITPELRVWWKELEKEARSTKELWNCYGRRLRIMERITDEALESIVAFKPQSAIGDHVCQVIYASHEDDEWPTWGELFVARMALNNHDALICLAPLDKIKTCLRVMKRHAERPLTIKGEQLIIPASCKVSQPDDYGVHRWSSLKSVAI